MCSLAFDYLFVSRITQKNILNRFSKNSLERWHMEQGRNDSNFLVIQILIRIQEFLNGILTTLGDGHNPDGWVMFNEFNLHARLPAFTCFRLQVI